MQDSYQDHIISPQSPRHRFNGHPIISDQISSTGLRIIYGQLEKTLGQNIPGAVVEFGCYAGTTSLFIRRLLDKTGASAYRQFHVYDSFAGLPAKKPQDTSAAGVDFTAGKLSVSKKTLLQQFKNAHLQPPIIHKGWFDELSAADVPQHIAFAFLDGDFYDSIISSLHLVWPRLSPGGRILIDDYQRESLPGVEKAVHDFFQAKQQPALRVTHNIAIIQT